MSKRGNPAVSAGDEEFLPCPGGGQEDAPAILRILTAGDQTLVFQSTHYARHGRRADLLCRSQIAERYRARKYDYGER